MLKKFETYQLAKQFYQACKPLKVPRYLQEQLQRASSSIVLNIAEGSGKRTNHDQRRFYAIALGSLRECQAIIDIEELNDPKLDALSDRLGAMLYRLRRKPFAKNEI